MLRPVGSSSALAGVRSVAGSLLSTGTGHGFSTTRALVVPSVLEMQRRMFGGLGQRNLPMNLGVLFVPEREAWVVERMGKFQKVLPSGLSLLIPVLDRVAYVHSLKVVAFEIESQQAITRDNVVLNISGVLYYQIYDPFKASYNVDDPEFAIQQLAMSTMRAEIGKLTLEKTFEERNMLNEKIVEAINASSFEWGLKCLRYEIRDLEPPEDVLEAMKLQVIAERRKREQIITSEGDRQAEVNVAEGQKLSRVLQSEGTMQQIQLIQQGEANGLLTKARATAESLKLISEALATPRGKDAVAMRLAEQYIEAFKEIAKNSNTLILPSNVGDISSMVTQATAVFNKISQATNAQTPDALARQVVNSIEGGKKPYKQSPNPNPNPNPNSNASSSDSSSQK